MSSPPGERSGSDERSGRTERLERARVEADVDSRWWLVVAAAAAFWAVAYALGVLFALVAVLGVFGGAFVGGGHGFPFPLPFFPGAFGLAAVLIVPLVLVGLLVSLLLPVALYLDSEAVGRAGVGWEPDPVLYAIAGVVGLFAQGLPIQPAVALYYLYRRHEHVGVP